VICVLASMNVGNVKRLDVRIQIKNVVDAARMRIRVWHVNHKSSFIIGPPSSIGTLGTGPQGIGLYSRYANWALIIFLKKWTL